VNFERYSAGRCFPTSARSSASVESSKPSGMMIGRGKGHERLGAGNDTPHAKALRDYHRYGHSGDGVELAARPCTS
jgi:hypothetical protein